MERLVKETLCQNSGRPSLCLAWPRYRVKATSISRRGGTAWAPSIVPALRSCGPIQGSPLCFTVFGLEQLFIGGYFEQIVL